MRRGRNQQVSRAPKLLEGGDGPRGPGGVRGKEVVVGGRKSNIDKQETLPDSQSQQWQDSSLEVRKSARLGHRLASRSKLPPQPLVKVAQGNGKTTSPKPEVSSTAMTLEAEVIMLKRENEIFREKIMTGAKNWSRKAREVKVQKGLVAVLTRVLGRIVDSKMPFQKVKALIGGAVHISGGMVEDPEKVFNDCFDSWDQEERLVGVICDGMLKGLEEQEQPTEPVVEKNEEDVEKAADQPPANVSSTVEQPELPSQYPNVPKDAKEKVSHQGRVSVQPKNRTVSVEAEIKKKTAILKVAALPVATKTEPYEIRQEEILLEKTGRVGGKVRIGSDGYNSDSLIRGGVLKLKRKKMKVLSRPSGYTSEPNGIGSRKPKAKSRGGKVEGEGTNWKAT